MSEDMFDSLKFLFIFSKICTTVMFDIKGHCGDREIKINKLIPLFMLINFIFITGIYLEAIISFFNETFDLEFIPLCFVFISQVILITVIYITQIVNINKTINMYERLYLVVDGIDFGHIRIFYMLLIFLNVIIIYVSNVTFFSFGVQQIFMVYFQIVILSTIVQFMTLLYVVKRVMCKINGGIKFLNVKTLKKVVDLHLTFYEMCGIINSLYSFIIFNIATGFFGLVYTAFMCSRNKYSFNKTYNIIMWNNVNIICIFMIVCICEITKFEVRDISVLNQSYEARISNDLVCKTNSILLTDIYRIPY